jgi:hypothetical protein
MEEDGLMFGGRGCFVLLTFTVAVFRREILTVEV